MMKNNIDNSLFVEKPGSWRPREIMIHSSVKDDPVTLSIVEQCPGVPTKYVNSGIAKNIVRSSHMAEGS